MPVVGLQPGWHCAQEFGRTLFALLVFEKARGILVRRLPALVARPLLVQFPLTFGLLGLQQTHQDILLPLKGLLVDPPVHDVLLGLLHLLGQLVQRVPGPAAVLVQFLGHALQLLADGGLLGGHLGELSAHARHAL